MLLRNLSCAFIISALLACNNEQKATADPIPKNIDYASLGAKPQKAMVGNPTTGEVVLNPKHGEPGHRCDIAVGMPLNSPAPKATPAKISPTSVPIPNSTPTASQVAKPAVATAQGMNPPHGQPNHRCDIAVGAALNSKPASTAIQTAPKQPATTVTAKGMNPPHGQPNHRCDIAVGAPLNSKPAPAPTSAPVNAPQPAPPTINPPVNTTTGNN